MTNPPSSLTSKTTTALEQAAIDFYEFVAARLGTTADYPLEFNADNEEDMRSLVERLNALRDEVRRVRPDLW